MFKLLQAHEEREPRAVLKTQSKRAQKRLIRQEARREEVERERDAELDKACQDRANCGGKNGTHESITCSTFSEGAERMGSAPIQQELDQQAVREMYADIFFPGDVDPQLIADSKLLEDIAVHLWRVNLEPAGATAENHVSVGSNSSSINESAAPGILPASRGTNCKTDLYFQEPVVTPPGPGPGPSAAGGPGPAARAWARLNRHEVDGGSPQGQCWQPEPLMSDSCPRAAQSRCGGGRSGGGGGGGTGAASAVAMLCMGSGIGAAVTAGDSGDDGGGDSGGRSGQHAAAAAARATSCGSTGQCLSSTRTHQPPPLQQQQQLWPSVTSNIGNQRQPQQQILHQNGAHHRQHIAAAHRRGGLARQGAHHGGVKVLHAARPHGTHGSSHGRGSTQPPRQATPGGGLKGCNGISTCGGNASGGGGDDATTDINLSLLWDLLQGGLCIREDPLAAEDGDLKAPEPGAVAAIKRLVNSRYRQDDGPARGMSPEDMITMMARAHKRQCKKIAAATVTAEAAAVDAASAGGDGDSGGDDNSNDDGDDDDGAHLYLDHGSHSRCWRRTVDRMKENDWVLVKGTDGKHYKYRRLLPNGQIQTQTVCCSSSDAMRGIRNLHADLARKDAQANAVIVAWRREERERRRLERATAAAAAAVQEGC